MITDFLNSNIVNPKFINPAEIIVIVITDAITLSILCAIGCMINKNIVGIMNVKIGDGDLIHALACNLISGNMFI